MPKSRWSAIAFAATVALGGCVSSPTPKESMATVLPSPAETAPGDTTAPSEQAPASVSCEEESRPVPTILTNACPQAVASVRAGVASLGWPIVRIVVRPGSFGCEIWPGVGTPSICLLPYEAPGRVMHSWVSFSGTDSVAALVLRRDIQASGSLPPTAQLWQVTIVAVMVPPTGWVMP